MGPILNGYDVYLFKKYSTVRFSRYLKFPPSAWMHILTLSTTETVKLRRTEASLTRLAASKVADVLHLVPTLHSYTMLFFV